MTYILPKVQYATPTTGQTVTIANAEDDIRVIINPAGALPALTVAMPNAPFTGQKVELCSTQAITTLTMSGGTIAGGLTSFAVNSFGTWTYYSPNTTWYRIS